MQTLPSHPLREDQTLLALLTEYQSALEDSSAIPAAAAEPVSEDRPGIRWVPRIRSLGEIDPSRLSVAHGRLIALGWLHFQLEDRASGLCYRVSPEGRAALEHAAAEAE